MCPHSADSQRGLTLGDRIRIRLASEGTSLPLFPDTAARVLEACQDPDGDIARVARLLESDPSLAANILRVSNSAAFAPAEPIISLQQAVSRLGLASISGIATAIALRSEVFAVEGHDATLRKLWLHSALAGAWAKEVARMLRKSVERAFLCGLLHDIGKPIVLQAAVDVATELGVELEEEPLLEVMNELHVEVAGRLLDEWKMPLWIQESALHHHALGSAGEHRDEVLMTALANTLAHAMPTGADVDWSPVLGDPALAELGLYADELDPLFERLESVKSLAEAIA